VKFDADAQTGKAQVQVQWIKCGDAYCELNTVDLQHHAFDGVEGVYIIWYVGQNNPVVRVGQGVIRDRLAAHRKDKAVQAYAKTRLFVTWAAVPAAYRDGVEKFLADQYTPLVGERFPDRIPVAVNLPQ